MPSFSIPLSGLEANSQALNAVSNNLANLNTVGYKDTRMEFRDLFYQQIGSTGAGEPIGNRRRHRHRVQRWNLYSRAD